MTKKNGNYQELFFLLIVSYHNIQQKYKKMLLNEKKILNLFHGNDVQ